MASSNTTAMLFGSVTNDPRQQIKHGRDRSDGMTGIYTRTLPELGYAVQIGFAGEKVISVSFSATTEQTAEATHPLLDRFAAYASGQREEFDDVDVGLTVPQTQRSVLETLRSVPYGQSIGFDRLLSMAPGVETDDEAAVGAARTAIHENPTPVVIPTHRISNGPTQLPAELNRSLRELEGIA